MSVIMGDELIDRSAMQSLYQSDRVNSYGEYSNSSGN